MFNTFRNDKCGGDVALYIRESLGCSLIKYFISAIPMLLEQLILKIHIQCDKNVVLSCICRSPNGGFNIFNDYVMCF